MKITRSEVAERLIDYLERRITLAELVDWAEFAMMEADFEEETSRDIVARLGLADVQAFGIAWEDYEKFLSQLGYQVKITITPDSR